MTSTRAQIITHRTYSRPKEDGTFESWTEIIERVISHQQWLWERAKGDTLNDHERDELSQLRDLFLSRRALPAGRTLWLGGTQVARERESSQFNCSYLNLETIHDVVDHMWLLLQGAGVGFTPVVGTLNGFSKPIGDVRVIRSRRTSKGGDEHNSEIWNADTRTWTIRIGDSGEAWAKAIGKLLAGKYPADILVFDLSEIRPGGQRLSRYGWISAGDEVLAEALPAMAAILSRRAGQLLTKIDILDIGNWMGVIQTGRRGAEIALMEYGDPEWQDFATAKKDFWKHGNDHRQQSNNSLVFHTKPSRSQLDELFEIIRDNGGSEPGVINGTAALARAPYFKGVNPCLVGDTLVPTFDKGLQRVRNIKSAFIRDGLGNPVLVEFKKTAENAELVEVNLSDGSSYKVTPGHRFVTEDGYFVKAKYLKPGDALKLSDTTGMFGTINSPQNAYLDAWLLADGTWHNDRKGSKLFLYEPKHKYIPALEACGASFNNYVAYFPDKSYLDKSRVPDYVLQGDQETILAFLKGYLESDGHLGETTKGWTMQICSIHKPFLEDLQALLRLLGVFSKISLMHKEGFRSLPNGHGGKKEYFCQDCFRLTVSNPLQLMQYLYPEFVKRGPYKRERFIHVTSVNSLEECADVYCCGVPTTNSFDLGTIHSGNCAEILLGNKSFCNLSELNLGAFKGNLYDARLSIRLLARANYRQTCVNLDDGILQRAWHENNEFLHLCGVGLTGIAEWEDISEYELRQLRTEATYAAWGMADELGFPRPKNVTTIKPSGTLSKIMDTTSGVHRPLGQYLFNNINFTKYDPVLGLLARAGYHIFDNPTDASSKVVRFPVEYDTVHFSTVRGVAVNQESAISQLERYKKFNTNYVDNNTSITVSYDDREIEDIKEWLDINWDNYVGVSFIPRTDPTKSARDLGYLYLPQEVVDENTYHKYADSLAPVSLEGTEGIGDLDVEDCPGGVCPVR